MMPLGWRRSTTQGRLISCADTFRRIALGHGAGLEIGSNRTKFLARVCVAESLNSGDSSSYAEP